MNHFFKKERLLLTLIIIFGLFFGILGGILKRTTYRYQKIDAPGIAFSFLAMHDGSLSKEQTKPTPESTSEPDSPEGPIEEPIEEAENESPSMAADVPSSTIDTSSEAETSQKETKSVFQEVDESYFTDALFIGDSRTDGLRLYAPFDGADYFCSTGMSVTKCLDLSADVENVGTVTLGELLNQRNYGKIYISLGINDVGYDFSYLVPCFEKIYNFVREQEPDAIIYIMASMHVAKNRAINEPIFESENVDELNHLFGAYADGIHSFFIDENEIFDDDEGYLIADYTGDNVHLYAKYYSDWDEWLCKNAVVIPGMENPGNPPSDQEDEDTSTAE